MDKVKSILIFITGFLFSIGMFTLIMSFYYPFFDIWISLLFFYIGIPLLFLIYSKYYRKSKMIEEDIRKKKGFQDSHNRQLKKILEDLKINN